MQVYHWPGNIRELESTVSRAALSAPGRAIRAADIEFLHAAEPPAEGTGERLPSLREAERAHIVRILDACSWNKKEAARILEISRGTLYRKILEFGLEPQAHNGQARHRPRRLTGTEDLTADDCAVSHTRSRLKTAQAVEFRLCALYPLTYSRS